MHKKFLLILLTSLCFLYSSFVTADDNVLLTASEKEYLNNHPIIKLCVDPDWLPYEKINEQGEYVGLVAEYLALISKRLNIAFDVLLTKSWDDSQKLYQKGTCDVVSALNKTDKRSEFLSFTQPYIKSPAVLVLHENNNSDKTLADLNGKTLGMVKGYVYESKLREQYPDIIIKYFSNMEEALINVSDKNIDATLGPLFLLFALTQELNLNNVKVMGDSEYQDELRMGINKDNAVLTSILSKAVMSLSDQDNADIRKNWAKKRQN